MFIFFVGNTATLSMDRAMAWVQSLDIFEDVVGGYIISSAIILKLYLVTGSSIA